MHILAFECVWVICIILNYDDFVWNSKCTLLQIMRNVAEIFLICSDLRQSTLFAHLLRFIFVNTKLLDTIQFTKIANEDTHLLHFFATTNKRTWYGFPIALHWSAIKCTDANHKFLLIGAIMCWSLVVRWSRKEIQFIVISIYLRSQWCRSCSVVHIGYFLNFFSSCANWNVRRIIECKLSFPDKWWAILCAQKLYRFNLSQSALLIRVDRFLTTVQNKLQKLFFEFTTFFTGSIKWEKKANDIELCFT